MDQNGAKRVPKAAKMEPKGSQNEPRDLQRTPCGTVSVFDAKKGDPPTVFGSHFGSIFGQNPLKMPSKNQSNFETEKVWKSDAKVIQNGGKIPSKSDAKSM